MLRRSVSSVESIVPPSSALRRRLIMSVRLIRPSVYRLWPRSRRAVSTTFESNQFKDGAGGVGGVGAGGVGAGGDGVGTPYGSTTPSRLTSPTDVILRACALFPLSPTSWP